MAWTELPFGKYREYTLPQLVLQDPDYFFWAYEKGALHNENKELKEEAEEIYQKATAIKIPDDEEGNKVYMQYMVTERGFSNAAPIPEKALPQRSHKALADEVINLYAPRNISPRGRDTKGCKSLVKWIKVLLFDDSKKRFTKKASEEFFNNNENFDLSRSGS